MDKINLRKEINAIGLEMNTMAEKSAEQVIEVYIILFTLCTTPNTITKIPFSLYVHYAIVSGQKEYQFNIPVTFIKSLLM